MPSTLDLKPARPSPPWNASIRNTPEISDRIRAHFGLSQDRLSVQRVAEFYTPPDWARGHISIGDALFLYELVRCVTPDRCVEIGVASGASAAVTLLALHDSGVDLIGANGSAALHGFDVRAQFYADESHHTGSAVADIIPQLAYGFELHAPAKALDALHVMGAESTSFAFIDANHAHPWAIADLVALSLCLEPGAWVAMHDIDLVPIQGEQQRSGKRAGATPPVGIGPQLLWEAWPGEKIRGEPGKDWTGDRNMGAIRMPTDGSMTGPNGRAALLEALEPAINRPWEANPGDYLKSILRIN